MERWCVIISELILGLSVTVQANKSVLLTKVWLINLLSSGFRDVQCTSCVHRLEGVNNEGPHPAQCGLHRAKDQDSQEWPCVLSFFLLGTDPWLSPCTHTIVLSFLETVRAVRLCTTDWSAQPSNWQRNIHELSFDPHGLLQCHQLPMETSSLARE